MSIEGAGYYVLFIDDKSRMKYGFTKTYND